MQGETAMNERNADPAALAAAGELAEMLTAILSPTELRLFMAEAFRVSKSLIEASHQQAVRNLFFRWEPSAN
jgi:hypothetical protein